MSGKDVIQEWHRLCSGRCRGMAVPERGRLPILRERDAKIGDAGIRW